MDSVNWLDLLGWDEDQIADIRFVGYSYIKQGKYDIARTFFEALLPLSSDNIYDIQTLGALYLQSGENLSALNLLERALQIEPEHGPTQLNRVKALFQLGYKRQALMYAQSLLQHDDEAIANQASALIEGYS